MRAIRYSMLVLLVTAVARPAAAEPLSVAAFRKLAPRAGEFELRAYAVKHYRCPPCLQDSACKPCMQNNVLVSDDSTPVQTYPAGERFLVVFTDEPELLSLGKRHTLIVRVLDIATTGSGMNDIALKRIAD